jgi:hypothetical protein
MTTISQMIRIDLFYKGTAVQTQQASTMSQGLPDGLE